METAKQRKEPKKPNKHDLPDRELELSNSTTAAFLGNKQRKTWMGGTVPTVDQKAAAIDHIKVE